MEEKTNKKRIFGLEHWQMIVLYLVVYDIIAVTLAYFLALLLRFGVVKEMPLPDSLTAVWEANQW